MALLMMSQTNAENERRLTFYINALQICVMDLTRQSVDGVPVVLPVECHNLGFPSDLWSVTGNEGGKEFYIQFAQNSITSAKNVQVVPKNLKD